jgi:Putative transposase
MSLHGTEFIRRYALHILPKGLVRIRHYGILCSTGKKKEAIFIKAQLTPAAPLVIIRPLATIYNPYNVHVVKKIRCIPSCGLTIEIHHKDAWKQLQIYYTQSFKNIPFFCVFGFVRFFFFNIVLGF